MKILSNTWQFLKLRYHEKTITQPLVIFFLFFSISGLYAFSGEGKGTLDDPYEITSVEQLQEMKNDLAAHYVLMNDIDASATSGWNAGAGFQPANQHSGKRHWKDHSRDEDPVHIHECGMGFHWHLVDSIWKR